MKKILNPAEEGITHINVYSKSNLEIGRMLSNFYRCEIDTPYGKFQSVEAYWHYLNLPEHEQREELKNLYGYEAKEVGARLLKAFKNNLVSLDNFEELISDAIKQKFYNNREMLLINEKYLSLPFEHYYVFDGRVVDVKSKYLWMINNITSIRGWLIDNYL